MDSQMPGKENSIQAKKRSFDPLKSKLSISKPGWSIGKFPFSYILPPAKTSSTPSSSEGLGLLPTQFGTTWERIQEH